MFSGLERKLDSKLDEKFGALFSQTKQELRVELKGELLAELREELLAVLRTEMAKDTRTRAASQDDTVVNRVHQLEGLVETRPGAVTSSSTACQKTMLRMLSSEWQRSLTATGGPLLLSKNCLLLLPRGSRLGAPSAARTKPRPLLVSFSGTAFKHAALKHRKALRQRKIYLDPDL
jgi:hypothetical protein